MAISIYSITACLAVAAIFGNSHLCCNAAVTARSSENASLSNSTHSAGLDTSEPLTTTSVVTPEPTPTVEQLAVTSQASTLRARSNATATTSTTPPLEGSSSEEIFTHKFLNKMDFMGVAMMQNSTMSNMKYLNMYDEQRSMPNRTSKVTMEMEIDVSEEPMLEMVSSLDVDSINKSEMMARTVPAANCNTYDQIIEIPNHKTNVFLDPSCIVIKQCAGCCGSPDLICRPTETKDVMINVFKYVYTGESLVPQKMVDTVKVVEHVSCQCGCKVLESHCNALQKYEPFSCECVCKEKTPCRSHQLWDKHTCSCQCPNRPNRFDNSCAVRGFYFNRDTCRCERAQ